MKILIITDAWHPFVSGVVTCLSNLVSVLERDHEVQVIHPNKFRTIPLWPYYRDYEFAYDVIKVGKMIDRFEPDTIHIATEGPLGVASRRHCVKKKYDYTTGFHTKVPEYLKLRLQIPSKFSYQYFKQFHKSSKKVLVTTENMKKELESRGFENLVLWSMGIDAALFCPEKRVEDFFGPKEKNKKNLVYVGRVAVEKNIEAFCELSENPDYQCWVIGDGPHRKKLEKTWGKQVRFVGERTDAEVSIYLASCDVSVFPSKTDTFGLTILESIACGTPVAAHRVTGPKDIIKNGVSGCFDNDLAKAVEKCLSLERGSIPVHAQEYSWEQSAKTFIAQMVPIH